MTTRQNGAVRFTRQSMIALPDKPECIVDKCATRCLIYLHIICGQKGTKRER